MVCNRRTSGIVSFGVLQARAWNKGRWGCAFTEGSIPVHAWREKGPTEGDEDVPPVRLCMAKGQVRSCVHGGL